MLARVFACRLRCLRTSHMHLLEMSRVAPADAAHAMAARANRGRRSTSWRSCTAWRRSRCRAVPGRRAAALDGWPKFREMPHRPHRRHALPLRQARLRAHCLPPHKRALPAHLMAVRAASASGALVCVRYKLHRYTEPFCSSTKSSEDRSLTRAASTTEVLQEALQPPVRMKELRPVGVKLGM